MIEGTIPLGVVVPAAAAIGGAAAAAGVAMWRQVTRRIDDLRSDLLRVQDNLLDCVEARGSAGAKIKMLEERLARVENGHRS